MMVVSHAQLSMFFRFTYTPTPPKKGQTFEIIKHREFSHNILVKTSYFCVNVDEIHDSCLLVLDHFIFLYLHCL